MKPVSTAAFSPKLDSSRRRSRHDCRMRALPSPSYVLSADRARQTSSVSRRHLLGSSGTRIRRSVGSSAARRPRACRSRRQPHRPMSSPAMGSAAQATSSCTALNQTGFANIPTSRHIDDGLALYDAYIVAAVRCAPPANAPRPEEITRCLDHLEAEIAELARVQVVVALGKIAFDVWLRVLKRRGADRAVAATAVRTRRARARDRRLTDCRRQCSGVTTRVVRTRIPGS